MTDLGKEYAECLHSIARDNESLKRALFIQWYISVEPSFVTGFYETLNPSSQLSVWMELDRVIGHEKPDPELEMMVKWYFQIAEWCFPNMNEFMYIRVFIQKYCQPFEPKYSASQFDNRGAMGEYWQSLEFAEK